MQLMNPPTTIEAMHEALDAAINADRLRDPAAMMKGMAQYAALRTYASKTWPAEFPPVTGR